MNPNPQAKKTIHPKKVKAVVERLLGPHGLWKAGEWEWRSCCPFHAGAENKTQFKVKWNGRWTCFSCGAYGSLENLVMRMEHVTYNEATEYIGNLPSAFLRMGDVLASLEGKLLKRTTPLEEEDGPSEAERALYSQFCPNYLLERGFMQEALEMFEIGYNKNRCKIVLPIRDVKGKLVGFTERMDYDGEGPKYWHDHFSKSDHLYGLHLLVGKPVKRLFLTEGQLDSVRLWQLGLRACAIMGSSISQEQVRLLVDNVHCEKLVLAFDNDEAGEKATLHAARLLAKTRFSSTLYCAKYPGKDPGELTGLKGIKLEPWFMALPLLKGG